MKAITDKLQVLMTPKDICNGIHQGITNYYNNTTPKTKEKKKNNNTVREKQVQNTLKVKSTCQRAIVKSTNSEHTHDIDRAYLRKADRYIGEKNDKKRRNITYRSFYVKM